MQGTGEVLGSFVSHSYNGKSRILANGEMYAIHMRKLDNISVRQNVSLESSFRWLLGDVFISKITAGFYEKLAKK